MFTRTVSTTFYKAEVKETMPIQIIGTNLYSVSELAQKLNVTTVTIRNYLKQGKLKGKKVMGRWLVLEEDTTQLLREIN